jgi:hypothetical protein
MLSRPHPPQNKETLELSTVDQIDLINIYRILYYIASKCTFLIYGTSSKIDNILGHNVNLKIYKKIKITSCILSDHNEIKVEIQSKINCIEYSNTWSLTNVLLSDQ